MQGHTVFRLVLCATLLSPLLHAAQEPVDSDQARPPSERWQQSEPLTLAGEAYGQSVDDAGHQRQKAAGQSAAVTNAASDSEIDMERARAIYQRRQKGQPLSTEDETHLQRAMAARRRSAGGAQPAMLPKWTDYLTPLTELGKTQYKGEEGGLYGGGHNEPPRAPGHYAYVREGKWRR